MDLIYTRAGTGEHDGALRRLEYHRHLVFAWAELDLKRAFWEWSIYSHLADMFGRATREGAQFPRPLHCNHHEEFVPTS